MRMRRMILIFAVRTCQPVLYPGYRLIQSIFAVHGNVALPDHPIHYYYLIIYGIQVLAF